MKNLQPGDPPQIGQYRLLGRLGQGGMGTVYLGEDRAGQRVAVKVINAEYSRHEVFRQRFRREAEAAQRVRRFCTAAVLDAALDGDQLYVVTEYVSGPNLEEAVLEGGPLRGSSLDALAVSVATALTAIHAAGVVHRDLKPSNVLLSPVGPRVIDFGIARALDTLGGITGTGEIIGTPRYLAPEVLRGEPVSPACDVFSWGALVAFAAAGRPPFTGEALHAVLYQVLNAEPDLTGLDPGVRELVAAALAKDPARRPSAQDLLDRMVGRVSPETAERSAVSAWRQGTLVLPDPHTAPLPGAAPPYGAAPAQPPAGTVPGYIPPGTTRPAYGPYGPAGTAGLERPAAPGLPGTGPGVTLPGPPPATGPTMSGGPTVPGEPVPPQPYRQPTAQPHAEAPAPAGGPRKPLLAAAVAVPVLVIAVIMVLRALSPGGPPEDLSLLYQDDFNQSGTGWDGGAYTGEQYGTYGYAPGGFYAIDVDGERPVRVVKAPIPFVPERPASPKPSASPTPLTPERLLLKVTATVRQRQGDGEIGLFCRQDREYKPSRYEFLLTTAGQARIRQVAAGTGGDLTAPVGIDGLNPDEPVTLQAECAREAGGVRLTMWVNGEHVTSHLAEGGLRNGDVGLLARVGEKSGAVLKASFDDFRLDGTPAGS